MGKINWQEIFMLFMTQLYMKFIELVDKLSPVMLFIIRLWMAHVFFASGLVKIDDFENTVALFRDEYKTPFLPPEIAAYIGTSFELACPVLLTFGLATRLATLPLLAMTAVIQFTYLEHTDHIYWAILLGTILTVGAGKISLDYLIAKKFRKITS